ncbi:MAG: hypothetical protein WAS54_04100 [Scrofimicrobium sp.]
MRGNPAIRYFGYGRHLASAGVVLFAGLIVTLLLWDLSLPTHILGQFDARWITSNEVISFVTGVAALALVAPIVPSLDSLATPGPRWISTLTAFSVVLAAAVMSPLVVWIWGVVPRNWIPRVENYLLPEQNYWDVSPVWGRGASAMTTAFLLGLCMVFIALFGKQIGLLLSVLSYIGLVVIQSSPSGILGFLPGQAGTVPGITPWAVIGAVVMVLIGLGTWYWTRASAPLIRTLDA